MYKSKFLLILLPIIGALISLFISDLVMRGSFERWAFLGTPPAGKAVKVMGTELVEVNSGDLYRFEYYNDYPNYVKWTRVEKESPPSNSENELPLEKCSNSYNLPSLNKFTDSKMTCGYWEMGDYASITAIDRAGNVYSWRKNIGLERVLVPTLSPCIGAFLVLFAIILFKIIRLITFYD